MTQNIEEFSGGKSQENGPTGRKKKKERVTGLCRRTRKEIVKWNQMTALRFQTGGRYQTPPASLRGYVVEWLLRCDKLAIVDGPVPGEYWH